MTSNKENNTNKLSALAAIFRQLEVEAKDWKYLKHWQYEKDQAFYQTIKQRGSIQGCIIG